MIYNLREFSVNRQATAILRYLFYIADGSVYFRAPSEINDVVERARDLPPCPIRYHKEYEWKVNRPSSLNRREMFDLLTETFGDRCHSCRANPAMIIDHDHIDNLARGVLCHECNNRVDRCLHLANDSCHHARYLNDHRAKELQLQYPPTYKPRGYLRDVASDVIGFDPIIRATWSHEVPAEWHWTPPLNSGVPSGYVMISNHIVTHTERSNFLITSTPPPGYTLPARFENSRFPSAKRFARYFTAFRHLFKS
ncbi:endonuclease domain-containing protein [Mycobacteroides abscessus]